LVFWWFDREGGFIPSRLLSWNLRHSVATQVPSAFFGDRRQMKACCLLEKARVGVLYHKGTELRGMCSRRQARLRTVFYRKRNGGIVAHRAKPVRGALVSSGAPHDIVLSDRPFRTNGLPSVAATVPDLYSRPVSEKRTYSRFFFPTRSSPMMFSAWQFRNLTGFSQLFVTKARGFSL